ncbi:MAG: hypothetical protein QXS69_01230 [Candidatus Aenigmatarchaeota archaeon]
MRYKLLLAIPLILFIFQISLSDSILTNINNLIENVLNIPLRIGKFFYDFLGLERTVGAYLKSVSEPVKSIVIAILLVISIFLIITFIKNLVFAIVVFICLCIILYLIFYVL